MGDEKKKINLDIIMISRIIGAVVIFSTITIVQFTRKNPNLPNEFVNIVTNVGTNMFIVFTPSIVARKIGLNINDIIRGIAALFFISVPCVALLQQVSLGTMWWGFLGMGVAFLFGGSNQS